jgi:hypothetical protein
MYRALVTAWALAAATELWKEAADLASTIRESSPDLTWMRIRLFMDLYSARRRLWQSLL